MPNLEEVFRLSGIPTYTFVEPLRYAEVKVSIRTPGRCLVVEGPSGIGKTTTITKALADLGLENAVLSLSARRPADIEIISALPDMDDIGTVIVDDFHRLPEHVKARLSDFMKLLADTANENSKLILIGINKAGNQLVKFAHDLGMRIDVFRQEANPIEKLEELISLGEAALNITISEKHKIAERAQGSFQIAQLLCHKVCTLNDILELCPEGSVVDVPLEVAIEDVMVDLSRQFRDVAVDFARGSKLRREGRAPYLHILRRLADSNEWSLDLSDALRTHPDQRGSVGQVIDKGYLAALISAEPLSDYFHFEPSTAILSVEDPKLIFYLKNLVWRAFTREVGFPSDVFQYKYDFALSFAGVDRAHAERLFDLLSEREVATFYDMNEQHQIMAQNIETYLAPIYRSEAKYVVPLLSPAFPTRIWTKFESDQFRQRFGENAVIPIRYSTAQPGFFSDDQKYGGVGFDSNGDVDAQLQEIADLLCKKLFDERQDGAAVQADATKVE